MTRVIFTKTYDHTPSAERRVTLRYRPSADPQVVTDECADRAIRLGFAEAVPEAETKPASKAKAKTRARG